VLSPVVEPSRRSGGEAIRLYIEREAAIVAQIRAGLSDTDRGNVREFDEAADELESLISQFEQERRKGT
jgi:predicted transcriptional regulator